MPKVDVWFLKNIELSGSRFGNNECNPMQGWALINEFPILKKINRCHLLEGLCILAAAIPCRGLGWCLWKAKVAKNKNYNFFVNLKKWFLQCWLDLFDADMKSFESTFIWMVQFKDDKERGIIIIFTFISQLNVKVLFSMQAVFHQICILTLAHFAKMVSPGKSEIPAVSAKCGLTYFWQWELWWTL